MTIKKILVSLALVAILALSVVSCSGTKNICPAYSGIQTSAQDKPNS